MKTSIRKRCNKATSNFTSRVEEINHTLPTAWVLELQCKHSRCSPEEVAVLVVLEAPAVKVNLCRWP